MHIHRQVSYLRTINIKIPHFTAHLDKNINHGRSGAEDHLQRNAKSNLKPRTFIKRTKRLTTQQVIHLWPLHNREFLL